MNLITDTVRSFPTFEKREEAFVQSVSALLPRRHVGPRLFWQDFSKIIGAMDTRDLVEPVAYITANPRDCLAFSTSRQVLRAAGMQAAVSHPAYEERAEEVARKFNFENHLAQPIRTLSGGETVKLALAKAHIGADTAVKLAMASPFCWLDKDNLGYLEGVLADYRKRNIPVTLFTLEGEDDADPIMGDTDLGAAWSTPVCFSLATQRLRLTLGSSLVAFNMPPPPEVQVGDFEARLFSPCLWVGGNGQGKSLMARVFSGAVRFRGSTQLTGPNGRRYVRLLFQDVIAQTLLRSFKTIRSQAGIRGSDTISGIYRRLISIINRMAPHLPLGESGPRNGALPTILETKAILVAVRLAHDPGALILDEPDWGLSRTAATAFVAAVVNVSHRLDLPVILITHKPWWDIVVKSRVRIVKSDVAMAEGRVASFQIRLEEVPNA